MRGGNGIIAVQRWIEGGSNISDPSAPLGKTAFISRGGFSPVRNQRKGFSPAANHTTGQPDITDWYEKKKQERYADPGAFDPEAFVGMVHAEPARGGIINAGLSNLALNLNTGGLVTAGAKTLSTITNKTLSGTMPRITYSPANVSKSYTASGTFSN